MPEALDRTHLMDRKPLSPLATHLGGRAVGPLDGPTADLADGQRGVVIAEGTADEVIREQMGVSMAAPRQPRIW
jgi:hypothetical protein